jgi:hypothetical protein
VFFRIVAQKADNLSALWTTVGKMMVILPSMWKMIGIVGNSVRKMFESEF